MLFSAALRRAVLLAHVISSVGLIGAVAAFLALAVLGAATANPALANAAYIAMSAITWPIIVPLAIAALGIGIIQSLGTPWRLFLHYWIILKLVLTTLSVLVLALQLTTIQTLARAAIADNLTGLESGRHAMVLHSAGGSVVLVLITLLSVYKPRGTVAAPRQPGTQEPPKSFQSG